MPRIPRLHLFELEDQPWFPSAIRDFATDYLHFIGARFALHLPAVALLVGALRDSRANEIVDLCSGAAGPIPALLVDLKAHGLAPRAILTDRFPNAGAFQRAADHSSGQIDFCGDPVDARAVPPELRGLRTLFNSFHHFRPQDAVAVLRDAAERGQPIAIFDCTERKAHTLISMILLTPLMVAIATPFLRPFSWSRLLWTYLLPLVPLTCWWDGIVSQLRAYFPDELQRLGEVAEPDGYLWTAGRVPIGSTRSYMTYLIGHPRARSLSSEKPVPLGHSAS